MSLEALFGDGVVGLELDPHVVVLGRDDFGDLGAAVLAVQLGVGGEAAADFHVVVFAHLDTGGHTFNTRFRQATLRWASHA